MIQWRLIKRFDNKYAVSNTGLIKSIKKNKILTQSENTHGYKQSTITFKSHNYRVKIHREVAFAFLQGPIKDQVNHIDGDKSNNYSSNLQWCTRQENMSHSWDTGLRAKYATHDQKTQMIKTWLLKNKISIQDLIKITTDIGLAK